MTHSVFAAPKTSGKNNSHVDARRATLHKSLTLLLSGAVFVLGGCSQNSSQAAPTDEAPAGPAEIAPQAAVPAGEFIMGSNRNDDEGLQQRYGLETPLFVGEHPEHKITLPAFKMDVYEVTNGQYKEFLIKARGRGAVPAAWGFNGYGLARSQADAMDIDKLRMIASEHFQLDIDTTTMDKPALIEAMFKKQKEMDKLPVTGVSWNDADAFCKWRGQRLPTEAEWEKAARGPKGLEFPWGNEWDAKRTNTGDNEEWEDGVAPVGAYKDNASPYGIYDLSGNAWEWTADWYEPYAGSTYKSEDFGRKHKVIRGGGGGLGHYAISYFFRGATRHYAAPDMQAEDVGFRCVSS